MTKITRRTALGFLGVIAVPSAAVVAAAPVLSAEGQADKCRRLIGELMAEMAKLPMPLKTMGGPAVDLSDTDRGEHIRFSSGKPDDPKTGAMLLITMERPLS